MIGRRAKTKRVMTKKTYKEGLVRSAAQDGSREFITLLACICADGTATPLALIYQGLSGDLQDTWLKSLKEEDKAYFTVLDRGWTNYELGILQLYKFAKDTKNKAGNRSRLLILDDHSSHVNIGFIRVANSYNIRLLVLPAHLTDRL